MEGHAVLNLVKMAASPLLRRAAFHGRVGLASRICNLGITTDRNTVKRILNDHGIEPAPERKRKTSWATFLAAHWDALAGLDFFTLEVLTLTGIIRYHVLFAIQLKTREVQIVGVTADPCEAWMKQMARNLTDPFEGFLKDKKYLIHDRDPLFTKDFRMILRSSGIRPIRTLPMSPHLTPIIERFIRSIKSECLDRMLIFGERHLRYVVNEFVEHYHKERAHQGLNNEIIEPPPQGTGEIVCQERLGGLLKFYRRAA